MTEDELKQFEALAKKFEDKDKAAVMKIIQTDIHPVFQDINDGGRTAANAANATKLAAVEKELKEKSEKLTAAETALAAIDEKAPDVAKLRRAHEEEIVKLRGEYDVKLKERDQAVMKERLAVAKQNLINKLTDSKNGVDKDYASTVLANREDVVSRLLVEADGSVKVLKKGEKELTIVPAEGKDPLDHLAEELSAAVEPKWKESGKGRGTGTKGGGGGSSTKTRFDQTRERVAEQQKEREKAKSAGSGLERLGRS